MSRRGTVPEGKAGAALGEARQAALGVARLNGPSQLTTSESLGQAEMSYDAFTSAGISGKNSNSPPAFFSISATEKMYSERGGSVSIIDEVHLWGNQKPMAISSLALHSQTDLPVAPDFVLIATRYLALGTAQGLEPSSYCDLIALS